MGVYRVWVHLVSGEKFEARREVLLDASAAHEAAMEESSALEHNDIGWSDVINGRVRNRDILAISYSEDEEN